MFLESFLNVLKIKNWNLSDVFRLFAVEVHIVVGSIQLAFRKYKI